MCLLSFTSNLLCVCVLNCLCVWLSCAGLRGFAVGMRFGCLCCRVLVCLVGGFVLCVVRACVCVCVCAFLCVGLLWASLCVFLCVVVSLCCKTC